MKHWILFTFLPFTLTAQTSILSGTVKFSNGQPVPFANVSIRSPFTAVMTDESGKFEFRDLAHGRYEIEVSSLEITPKTFTVNHTGRQPLTLAVEESSTLDLKEVQITGKTEKKEIETVGFATNVVETQKFALQSIQTNELLDRTAGVRIRQDGGLGSHIHYNINGMGGNAVKIFMDGVPASNYGSAFSLNSIPPALIERIEVYKGVVPGNLSEDALGGAINVVLKKQKARNSLITSYSIGSFNTHQWNMTGSFRQENGFTVNASAFYNYSDNNYKVWGHNITHKDYTGATVRDQKERRFHDAYQSFGGRINVGYTGVKWADRFLLGAVLSEDYKEVQHGRTMDKPYGDRHTRGNSNVATLSYEKNDLLLSGLSLKVDASYSYLKRQVIDTVGIMYDWRGKPLTYPDGSFVRYINGAETGSTKTTAINSDKTFVTRANLGYTINRNHHIYANYLFNNFKRGTLDEMQPLGIQKLENTRDLQKNILSFTYENMAFSQRLRTNIFYKQYFQKVTSNEPFMVTERPPVYDVRVLDRNSDHSGYGMALSYTVSSKIYLLGSGEKAIRLPNANEIFGNVADNLLPPVTELKPEVSYNANVGVNLGPFLFNKHSVRVNSSVFYRNTQGMIREGLMSGNNDNTRFENLEDVETKGIDAEIIYKHAQKFDFNFNISKLSSLFNTEFNSNGQPYLYYRTQIRNEPSFKFNANAAYYFSSLIQSGSRTSVYYNINYVKGFLRNWENIGGKNLDRIPTQFANDLGIAHTLPSQKVTVSADAKNIFNQQIFDNFGLQKPGRAFYVKVTYSFLK